MEGPQRHNTAGVKPTPPRKPLTPYMRFSKSIWQSVKVSNPSMSVCEIGATIGKMWRELTDEQKQKFNEDFVSEKAKYDEELAHYLKVTGLQASDLVKSKSKKKDSNKNNQASHAQAPTPPMMPMPNPQMAMHHMAPPGYPGNAGHMMAPPGFSQSVNSSVAGALPHFSQIWASSPYEQNMQMNLMAMNAHQNMMEGRSNGQHQFNFAHAQEQVSSMSPMYNGSPQMSQAASPHMHSSSPISQQSTTPSQEQQQMQQQYEAMREKFSENGGNSNQNQQHHPQPNHQQQQSQRSQQQHQQNQHNQQPAHQPQQQSQGQGQTQSQGHGQSQWPWPGGPPSERQFPSPQDQNGHHSNGANGIQQQQQSQSFESPQPQANAGSASASPQNSGNSRPPSVSASDHMDSTPPIEKKEEEKPPQTPDKPQPSPAGSGDSNPGSGDPQKKPEGIAPTMTTGMATTTTSFPTYPSAHNVFNSFGNFNQGPWAQHAANSANRQAKEGSVFNRESILETELSHLRSALSEKTKEVQRLTQELEKAHGLIQQLQAEKLQH